MPKKLIVCADGTWNQVEKRENGALVSTNVAKLAASLTPRAPDGEAQVLCYLEGVGTHEDDRVSGGAFGWGLSVNILRAYEFLAGRYRPGDTLHFFGFSRGAYTVRSLAGLIRNCGLLRADALDQTEAAMALYRDRTPETDPDSVRARIFRHEHAREVSIACIGVWDTVGSLGTPLLSPGLARALGWDWHFHNANLSGIVRHAFHAMAIHEQRSKFPVTLWEQKPEHLAAGQILEQLWFCGAHGDVGGGYAEAGLSDAALDWMIGRAQQSCGLGFDPAAIQRREDPKPVLHSEFRGFFRWLDTLKGKPQGTPRTFAGNCPVTRQSLHPSVRLRFEEYPEDPWPRSFQAALALLPHGLPVSPG